MKELRLSSSEFTAAPSLTPPSPRHHLISFERQRRSRMSLLTLYLYQLSVSQICSQISVCLPNQKAN